MLESIFPKLLELLIKDGLPENSIQEITLNEKYDGSLVLINHDSASSYCATNKYQGNFYSKQFHAKKDENGEWRKDKAGCNHACFEQLSIKNLGNDWQNKLTIGEEDKHFYFN